ncbi:Hpt domain-containing protein [Zhouia sp. PK063]|uniref:Hpt domain-containing protein n=1 Tax=Zhouia sp. PK063 TaxID=3373602 RepID=UPI00378F9A04
MINEAPNNSYIRSLSGGDESFEKQLMTLIKKEMPDERKAYENCIVNKNYEEASQYVHKLRHKISILGLSKSYEVATDYEEELLNDNTSKHEFFIQLLDKMEDYVNNY